MTDGRTDGVSDREMVIADPRDASASKNELVRSQLVAEQKSPQVLTATLTVHGH